MSRQIEIEFSYSETDEVSALLFKQDLLADLPASGSRMGLDLESKTVTMSLNKAKCSDTSEMFEAKESA